MKVNPLRNWPLWALLIAETVLTLPWLWRTAPFTDEALYLIAGQRELSHWLHHTPMPAYPTWFSGAAIFYPPLGAALNSIGGIVAARAFSLLLMLSVTVLVYLSASRMFDYSAALFSSALYAVSGIVIHYGAFATYDSLALFFLALATWAAVRVRDGGPKFLVLCVSALVFSNAAKYATLAWDPVVVGMLVLHNWDRQGWRALGKGIILALSLLLVEVGLLLAGGPQYTEGLRVTTVFRHVEWGYSSSSSVVWRAFALTGVLVLTALVGVMLSVLHRSPIWATAMLMMLVGAAIIAPIDQARIHEISSLDKNIGFGLSFVALASGFAISKFMGLAEERFPKGRVIGAVLGGVLVLLVLVMGRVQSVQFRGPSDKVATQMVGVIQRGYRSGTYILTDSAPWMEKYYLTSIPETAWHGLFDPHSQQRIRFYDRICNGRVSLVILRLKDGVYIRPYDKDVYALMENSRGYQLAMQAGQGHLITQIWRRIPERNVDPRCG